MSHISLTAFRFILVSSFLLMAACAGQTKDTENSKLNYPVSAEFGTHTYPAFIASECGGIDSSGCASNFWFRFYDKLINHYGDTGFNYKKCSLTDVCLDDISFEHAFRN